MSRVHLGQEDDRWKAKDPLAKQNFMAKYNRNIYNKWYQYNKQNFCCSSTEFQPDLQVSAGEMPTLYGGFFLPGPIEHPGNK